jgi:hypothetical protein
MTDTPASTTPLRLADAIKHAFPFGGMTVSGLRREADRGRLVIERIAGKDFTTLAEIEAMRERCRVPLKPGRKVEVKTPAKPATPESRDGVAVGAFRQKLSRNGAMSAMEASRAVTREQLASSLRKREIEVLTRLVQAPRPLLFLDATGGPATMALLYARGYIGPDRRHDTAYVSITNNGRAALGKALQ